jgi:hypothetical protein
MKTLLLIAIVFSATCVWAQSTGVVATPVYDSPLVKIIGDGRQAPNLPPVAFFPENPPPPQVWGPRAFAASGRFQNSSFRASVGTNDPVIGGLVISDGGRVVLVRAVGPSLASFGISSFLQRPQLQIFDSVGRVVATAVAWSANPVAIRDELKKTTGLVGAFPLREGSQDQVLLIYLASGSYSCVISGQENDSGVVLFEAFDVPSALASAK